MAVAAGARDARDRLVAAAHGACGRRWAILPRAGAPAAIQLLPARAADGPARIVAPTCKAYAGGLPLARRKVEAVGRADALKGTGLAIAVNPVNPDGRRVLPVALRRIAGQVGLPIVDESFARASGWSFIAPVSAKGIKRPAAMPRSGQTAPKMRAPWWRLSRGVDGA